MIRVLAVLAAIGTIFAGAAGSSPDSSKQSSIGYPTVDAALADLKSQSGIEVREQDGWTIITDSKHNAIWSFTPAGHPAYPAAVKRTFVERNHAVYVEVSALCQAEKKPCDELIEQFKALNEKMREQMAQRNAQGQSGPPKAATSADSSQVQTKMLAKDRYELTVTVAGTTDPADAQRALAPFAVKLCGRRSPQFGKYKFDASEPLTKASGAGSASVTLIQQLSCGGAASSAMATPQTAAHRQAPTPVDEARVRARTLAYLAAKDRGDFETAHAMLAQQMQATMTRTSWQEPRAAFNAAAGIPTRREIVRVTWYDNPSGAAPGRYAAADYRASYRSSAFYCGYIGWMQQADGSYQVVREEEGQLAPKEAAKVAPGQMAAMRLQLGCRD